MCRRCASLGSLSPQPESSRASFLLLALQVCDDDEDGVWGCASCGCAGGGAGGGRVAFAAGCRLQAEVQVQVQVQGTSTASNLHAALQDGHRGAAHAALVRLHGPRPAGAAGLFAAKDVQHDGRPCASGVVSLLAPQR